MFLLVSHVLGSHELLHKLGRFSLSLLVLDKYLLLLSESLKLWHYLLQHDTRDLVHLELLFLDELQRCQLTILIE